MQGRRLLQSLVHDPAFADRTNQPEAHPRTLPAAWTSTRGAEPWRGGVGLRPPSQVLPVTDARTCPSLGNDGARARGWNQVADHEASDGVFVAGTCTDMRVSLVPGVCGLDFGETVPDKKICTCVLNLDNRNYELSV